MAPSLSAIVLADSPLASVRIAGLPVRERAIRIAKRVGASTVYVVTDAASRAALTACDGDRVLVIRADQLVHTPLVAPLVASDASLAIAVGPDDGYAGAFIATGHHARKTISALARGDEPALDGAERIPHGAIARHPIATRAERRDAHRLLYKILIKPQDNPITRYLFRPVSFPLTRMLAWTPITPNQISLFVGLLGIVGIWFTAHASMTMAITGTAFMLVASYVDCCDGEIARIKLLSSKYGAWIDTVIDELSTMGYMVALGYHCYLAFGSTFFSSQLWLVAAFGSWAIYAWGMYCIYYNIIVGVGSANSQDYVGRFDVVATEAPGTMRLQPHQEAAKQLPPLLDFVASKLTFIIRRDFIVWCTMILAILHLTHVSFVIQVLGGLVSFPILTMDHLRLRKQRRSIERAGGTLLPAN